MQSKSGRLARVLALIACSVIVLVATGGRAGAHAIGPHAEQSAVKLVVASPVQHEDAGCCDADGTACCVSHCGGSFLIPNRIVAPAAAKSLVHPRQNESVHDGMTVQPPQHPPKSIGTV
jgi:hypothetical protein